MKKNFLAGLAILLPIVITAAIALFFINLLTTPFMTFVSGIFTKTGFSHFLPTTGLLAFISKIFILFFLVFVLFIIGFFTQHFFAHHLFQTFDKIIHKIPVINKIYISLQEVAHTLFGEKEESSFSKVALVPFPQKNCYSIGFVTKEALPKETDKEYLGLISVYVPGTPNPLMGFNFLYKREEVILLDMNVDDALKFIISCGVMDVEIARR